jgi:GNAT superfamily N-acetyltransferase
MNEPTDSSETAVSLASDTPDEFEIRRSRPDDAPALVALYNSQEAESGPRSVEEFLQKAAGEESDAGSGLWVAVDGERRAGYVAWDRAWWTGRPDIYAVEVRVERNTWGVGLGQRLYASLLSQPFAAQPTRFLAWIRADSAEAQRFAARNGFELTGQVVEECRLHLPDAQTEHASEIASRLDAEGIRILSLTELQVDESFLRRLHRLWTVDASENGPEFETWRSSVLNAPGLSPDTHWVALDGENPIGTTFLKRLGPDGAENDYTAVAPEYRGRGIAYALKHRAIGWGRANQIQWFYTSSLLENAPMIAINRRLGYLPGIHKQEIARDLDQARCP